MKITGYDFGCFEKCKEMYSEQTGYNADNIKTGMKIKEKSKIPPCFRMRFISSLN